MRNYPTDPVEIDRRHMRLHRAYHAAVAEGNTARAEAIIECGKDLAIGSMIKLSGLKIMVIEL